MWLTRSSATEKTGDKNLNVATEFPKEDIFGDVERGISKEW